MAVKVKNLKIQLQKDTDNTYFATWDFASTNKGSTATSIKTGSIVKIKSGAKWYGGQSIDSWVFNLRWKVLQISGDRAVLNKSPDDSSYAIESPINTKYLTLASSSSSSTSVDKSTLDHYDVQWFYDTGNGVWFDGGSSDVKLTQSIYSPPANALRIKVWVRPTAKKHKVNDKDVSYWSGTISGVSYTIPSETSKPPEKPDTPSVEIDKTKLTATLEGIDDVRADIIKFYVYRANDSKVRYYGEATVKNQRASYTCTVASGYKYQVRCVAINKYSTKKLVSEYSDYTSPIDSIPKALISIKSIKALTETSVKVSWDGVSTATSYQVEYTTDKNYFNSSSEVQSVSVNAPTIHTEITGLESGQKYFFRARAVNEQGESSWTSIKSIIIGKSPSAPTTWSSTTTATVGEFLYLYWVHNSEDGSSQTYAELELTIDGTKSTKTIKNSTDEEKKDLTSSYSLSTISYKEGTKILWRVRTKGILDEYGDWSIQRTIDVYAKPSLELDIVNKKGTTLDTITSFPFYISGVASPSTQKPIGYHIEISANESYETVDNVGNKKLVSVNENVYSKYFDVNAANENVYWKYFDGDSKLMVEMSAENIDLENGISYTMTCTVSMNSGLSAESSYEFTVSWADEEYDVDASIAIDSETLVSYIRPYCTTTGDIDLTDEDGKVTETITTDDILVEGVTLSVYRREYNGEFVEIATGLDNSKNTIVTDPHPALDYARYRIVAKTESTGAISFYDPPGYPVGEKSIIIQWDDDWTNFESFNEDSLEEPAWSGSMLKLPYNIDVSDKNNPDVSLIEYIGRKRPVTYYGTHIGETASWSVAIPKDDKDTLYALRRLAIYMGDVYVREPSGSGYWANVKVSFSQTHCELTIPVTLEITRVEGGI